MKPVAWVALAAAAVVILGGGGYVAYQATRGWRNNNPFNLRKSSDRWQGLAREQTDPAFFQFESLDYGIRAGLIVLRNYYARYGLDTVRGIIHRFAPPSENNTDAYVAHVARQLGVDPDERIDVPARLGELGAAIMKHENGVMHPQWKTALAAGLTLAGYPGQARAYA